MIVANEVAQGETIVRGDEVNARARMPVVVAEEIAAPGEPGRQFAHRPAVSFPEAPHAVAIFAIPLTPEHREVADLVTVWSDVPRFGDQLHGREHRILLDDVE